MNRKISKQQKEWNLIQSIGRVLLKEIEDSGRYGVEERHPKKLPRRQWNIPF